MRRAAESWSRFWHRPLRAERLALVRIALGAALLSNQLFEYLPNLGLFFGPSGTAPEGLYDAEGLAEWRWTLLVFHTDDLAVVGAVFGVWVVATIAFLIGFRTRIATGVVWLLAMCFINRNIGLTTAADALLTTGLFWLLLSPCGHVLSVDALRLRRRGRAPADPAHVAPWSIRLLQIQLCAIYLAAGTGKLGDPVWRDGTALHYALNDIISRRSYAELPLPIWVTRPATYAALAFENLFFLVVSHPRTRKAALVAGAVFHLAIWMVLEVGWLSAYMVSFYFLWLPDDWVERMYAGARAARRGPRRP